MGQPLQWQPSFELIRKGPQNSCRQNWKNLFRLNQEVLQKAEYGWESTKRKPTCERGICLDVSWEYQKKTDSRKDVFNDSREELQVVFGARTDARRGETKKIDIVGGFLESDGTDQQWNKFEKRGEVKRLRSQQRSAQINQNWGGRLQETRGWI